MPSIVIEPEESGERCRWRILEDFFCVIDADRRFVMVVLWSKR